MKTVNYIIVLILRWTVFVAAGLFFQKSLFIKGVKQRVDFITRAKFAKPLLEPADLSHVKTRNALVVKKDMQLKDISFAATPSGKNLVPMVRPTSRSLPADLKQYIQRLLREPVTQIRFPDSSMFEIVVRWFKETSQYMNAADYKVDIGNFMGVWPMQIDTQTKTAIFSVDHVKPVPGTAISPPGDELTEDEMGEFLEVMHALPKKLKRPKKPTTKLSSPEFTQLVLKKLSNRGKHWK